MLGRARRHRSELERGEYEPDASCAVAAATRRDGETQERDQGGAGGGDDDELDAVG